MDVKGIVQQLENNREVFRALLFNITENQYLWRPKPDKWSLLEIVCHLLDEEQLDFRARTKHTLETPLEPMSAIDPEGWVVKHNYASKDYSQTFNAFLDERNKSVAWLKTQFNANWSNSYKHSQLGDLTAKQFLNNWLAHDYLHIRQINRYNYEYFLTSADTNLVYAGNW